MEQIIEALRLAALTGTDVTFTGAQAKALLKKIIEASVLAGEIAALRARMGSGAQPSNPFESMARPGSAPRPSAPRGSTGGLGTGPLPDGPGVDDASPPAPAKQEIDIEATFAANLPAVMREASSILQKMGLASPPNTTAPRAPDEKPEPFRLVMRDVEPSLFWLSFCDARKPSGQQFLGACIVEASDVASGVAAASALGIYPGGEAVGHPVDASAVPLLAEKWKNRLLTRAECEAMDKEVSSLQDATPPGVDPEFLCADHAADAARKP